MLHETFTNASRMQQCALLPECHPPPRSCELVFGAQHKAQQSSGTSGKEGSISRGVEGSERMDMPHDIARGDEEGMWYDSEMPSKYQRWNESRDESWSAGSGSKMDPEEPLSSRYNGFRMGPYEDGQGGDGMHARGEPVDAVEERVSRRGDPDGCRVPRPLPAHILAAIEDDWVPPGRTPDLSPTRMQLPLHLRTRDQTTYIWHLAPARS